jgi:RNA polymerase sigma-70 factor (sigma-E family)
VREPDGFREFVASRSPALLRTARLITGDADLAHDLVQAALAQAWPRWSRVDNPEAYVRTTMVRTYLTWRRRRWHGEMPTQQLPEPADDGWSAVDTRTVVRAALASLAPRQRAVLVLRYLDDLTEVQTAEALGCSVGTVKSQTSKALARLRDAGLLTEEDVR